MSYWSVKKISKQEDKEKRVCLLPSATTVCCSPWCSPGAAVSEPTIHRRSVASLSAPRSPRHERHRRVQSATAILRPGIRPALAGWRCSCTGHVGCGETSFSSPNLLLHRRHLLFFFQLLLVLRSQHRLHQRRLTRSRAAEAPATASWDLNVSWRSLLLY